MMQNTANPPPASAAYIIPQTSPQTSGQNPILYNQALITGHGNVHPNYDSKCVRGLSISLIVMGCLCFVVQFVDIFMLGYYYTAPVGAGIWSGVIFIITGVLGVVSSRKSTKCMVVAFLVMSIVGAVFSVAPIILGAIGVINANTYLGYPWWNYPEDLVRGSLAMNAIMILAAIANGILMIISSAYACKYLCSDKSQTHPLPGQVQQITGFNGQQQLVIVPMNQPMQSGAFNQVTNVPTVTSAMPGQQPYIISPTSTGHVYAQTAGHVNEAVASETSPDAPNGQHHGPPAYKL